MNTEETKKWILTQTEETRCRLLSRLQQDCEYYLHNGHRCQKHLWGATETQHISYMKFIWDSFPDDKKPEWLTYEGIKQYERQILKEEK